MYCNQFLNRLAVVHKPLGIIRPNHILPLDYMEYNQMIYIVYQMVRDMSKDFTADGDLLAHL